MAFNSEVITYNEIKEKYNPREYKSKAFMTKYEFSKILGLRMEQLSRNAPTLVDISKYMSTNHVNHETFSKIAQEEIKKNLIPFMIGRTLPNGKKEYWKLEDMIISYRYFTI